jgi:hypothetical protein
MFPIDGTCTKPYQIYVTSKPPGTIKECLADHPERFDHRTKRKQASVKQKIIPTRFSHAGYALQGSVKDMNAEPRRNAVNPIISGPEFPPGAGCPFVFCGIQKTAIR